jgi:cell division protein FtsB
VPCAGKLVDFWRRALCYASGAAQLPRKASVHLPRNKYYIIGTILVLAFLLGNAGFRGMVRRYWEMGTLRDELAALKKEHMLLKREVYFLEGDPSYIERIARRELGLIAASEVEYRFTK